MAAPHHVAPVAFVLTGSCGLAAAHVGMLRALADHLVDADVVIGCAVGALNGAAYAEHPTLAGLARLQHVWSTAADADLGLRPLIAVGDGHGTVGGSGGDAHEYAGADAAETVDAVERLARRAVRASSFDELVVRFECAAAGNGAGGEMWLAAGPLLHAIRASTAPLGTPPVHGSGLDHRGPAPVASLALRRAVDLGARTIWLLDEAGSAVAPAAVGLPPDVVVHVMPVVAPSRPGRGIGYGALIDATFHRCQALLDQEGTT